MEENTRNALDELAALFLTGTDDTESARADAPASAPEDPPDDALTGPEPIRLAPKRPRADQNAANPPHDEAGPKLRLHGDGSESAEALLDQAVQAAIRQGQQPDPAMHVEGVVLGNLPGLSGPWLTQYAQRLAREQGPVAVVHLDGGRVDLELIEPTDRPLAGGRAVGLKGDEDLVAALDRLATAGPEPVRTVLVGLCPEADEAHARRLRELPAWTLLCGADDAAVIAAYQLIKRLVDRDSGLAQQPASVMMLGCTPEQAQQAGQRLRDAVKAFLHTPLTLLGCQRQMMPVNLRQLGRFEADDATWRRLAGWIQAQSEPAPDEPEAGAEEPQAVDPLMEAIAAADAEAPASTTTDRSPETTAPAPAPEPEPTDPAPAAPTEAETGADEPDLAHFLVQDGQLRGGVALEARCPYQPRTQLVLDQQGRLHLLRRQEPTEAADEGVVNLRAAIMDLLEARKWVREHLDLLQLTQRQAKFDPQADPALHLFTERAEVATGLVARLGSMLKLHLLRRVRVGSSAVWFSTPLS